MSAASGIKIIIDMRERDVIREMGGSSFETKALPVGDIWITSEAADASGVAGIILERKTIADMQASIKDGR